MERTCVALCTSSNSKIPSGNVRIEKKKSGTARTILCSGECAAAGERVVRGDIGNSNSGWETARPECAYRGHYGRSDVGL